MTAGTASTRLRQPAAVPQMSDDDLCINTIRTLAIDPVQKANSGHAGTPMALAPIVYTLWQEFLSYDPADPLWPNHDRFVLSAGHASMLLYAVLHLSQVQRLEGNPITGKQILSAMRRGFGGHIEPDKVAQP
jgi:transketolase